MLSERIRIDRAFFQVLRALMVGSAFLCATYSAAWAVKLDDVMSMDVVVHFIDVGVGDAILIETVDLKHEIVIDGGDARRGFDFLSYARDFLDDPIELAVITHADFDHWSGIERLTKQFSVKRLWDPGYDRDCKFRGANAARKRRKDMYLKFIRTLPTTGMRLRRPVLADPNKPQFEIDGVTFTVLHADADPQNGECSYIVNDASIVIRVQYGDVVFLLTGDANGKKRSERATVEPTHVEKKLLDLEEQKPGILRADVLKVPHHGSETANTTRFIDAVQPRFAVISSSYTGTFELPKKRVLQTYQRARFNGSGRIEKVLRTNFGETNFQNRRFGDDHIICGTNGERVDVVCDYIWRFEE